jgi:hypothetical protein
MAIGWCVGAHHTAVERLPVQPSYTNACPVWGAQGPQLLGPGVPGATTLPLPLHACSPPDLVAVLCCTVLPLLLPQVLYPVVYEVLGEAAQQHAEVRGVLWPWRRGLRSGEAGRSGPAPATAQHSLFWPWLWPGKFFHA